MRRSRHSLPLNIKLSFNITSHLYEAIEDGIVYGLTLEQTRQVGKYYKEMSMEGFTFYKWYKDLSKEERGKVVLMGMPESNSDNGFYPDIQ